mmetsp:Transcript_13418/g.26042  ORF Transcript_13418/g.26042 Transcript_13418/m.26042 type:complete len:756 (+) Transcript_13418:43-2310(+)
MPWNFSSFTQSNFFQANCGLFFDPTGEPIGSASQTKDTIEKCFKFYDNHPTSNGELTILDVEFMLIDFFSAIPNIANCKSLVQTNHWTKWIDHYSKQIAKEMMVRHGNPSHDAIYLKEFALYFYTWFSMTEQVKRHIRAHGHTDAAASHSDAFHMSSPYQPQDMQTHLSREESANTLLATYVLQYNVGLFYLHSQIKQAQWRRGVLARKPFERTQQEVEHIWNLVKHALLFNEYEMREEEKIKVCRYMKLEEFERGDVIVQRDKENHKFYHLLSGTALVTIPTSFTHGVDEEGSDSDENKQFLEEEWKREEEFAKLDERLEKQIAQNSSEKQPVTEKSKAIASTNGLGDTQDGEDDTLAFWSDDNDSSSLSDQSDEEVEVRAEKPKPLAPLVDLPASALQSQESHFPVPRGHQQVARLTEGHSFNHASLTELDHVPSVTVVATSKCSTITLDQEGFDASLKHFADTAFKTKLMFYRQSPMTRNMPLARLKELARLSSIRRCKRNELVIQQGSEDTQEVYFVLSGEFRVVKELKLPQNAVKSPSVRSNGKTSTTLTSPRAARTLPDLASPKSNTFLTSVNGGAGGGGLQGSLTQSLTNSSSMSERFNAGVFLSPRSLPKSSTTFVSQFVQLSMVGPYGCFGEVAVMNKGKRTASVFCHEGGELLCLSKFFFTHKLTKASLDIIKAQSAHYPTEAEVAWSLKEDMTWGGYKNNLVDILVEKRKKGPGDPSRRAGVTNLPAFDLGYVQDYQLTVSRKP